MEVLLAVLGIIFVIAAFIAAKKQERDYLKLQERILERAQETSIYELQAAAADLTQELEEKTQQMLEELQTQYQHLKETKQSINQPVEEKNTSQMDIKTMKPSGRWGEREHLVREMSELGMNPEVIAQELGIGKGEVNLILALSREKEPKL